MNRKSRSRGFSLILSLTVMASVVMLVVTLSAFITIESRAAMNQQLATRARLNALVSMRLALGHLQQGAGADRRATARADITQPGVSVGSLLNPMWTGVWRTDKPDLPPVWLVSGRGDQDAGTQSVALIQISDPPDYHAGYWAPWQTLPREATNNMVELVGERSALPAAGSKPSGLVRLPKVMLPDDDVLGLYAYWIGDEGIKARINLKDDRSEAPSAADRLIALRSPVVAGLTGFKGLDSLTNPGQLGHIDTTRQLGLLAGFKAGASADPDAIATLEKNYFHDLSFVSAGVIADSFHGGLRRDLSRAFELSDDAFVNTEFGEGRSAAGSAQPDGAAGTHTLEAVNDGKGGTVFRSGYAGRLSSKTSDDPLMMAIVTGPASNPGGTTGSRAAVAAPVFDRTFTDTRGVTKHVRGPAWWALRDYHRLYQQLGWSSGAVSDRRTTTPELLARTFWPNAAVSRPNPNHVEDDGFPKENQSVRSRAYSYADIYNGDLTDLRGNPNASDFLEDSNRNADKGRLVTRPLHVAAAPYVSRMLLAFSLSKNAEEVMVKPPPPWRGPPQPMSKYFLYLNITPTVVLHNPYNVRLRLRPQNFSNNHTAFPAAISLAGIDDWKIRLTQDDGSGSFYERPIIKLMSAGGKNSASDDTLRTYLAGSPANPEISLEPGEFRVFSAPSTSTGLAAITNWNPTTASVNKYTAGSAQEISDLIHSEEGSFYKVDETLPFHAEIITGQGLRLRYALDCWQQEDIPNGQPRGLWLNSDGSPPANDKNFFYRNTSEHTELVIDSQTPVSVSRRFESIASIRHKFSDGKFGSTGPTQAPTPLALIDISAKPANDRRAPFPLFTHSNPMAGSLRASGAGRTSAGIFKGTRGAPASYGMNVSSASDWTSIIQQPDPLRAFGGYSSGAANGSERVILTEVPLVQPTSLAQYTHANFGVRDQQPLLSIGNSFASPLIDATKVIQDNVANWTEFDQTYLLNAALWDGFFLSSLAPWMKTDNTTASLPDHPKYKTTTGGNTATAPANQVKSVAKVIEEFVLNGTPLDNPRFSLERSGMPDEAIIEALDDYRRSASVLLNQGAFNVNSTSLEAWKAFLGNAKQQSLQGLASDAPGATNNARFPRTVTRQDSAPAAGNAEDPRNWDGFANLSDAQIEKLAKAIIAENKESFTISVRGERDQTPSPGTRRFGGHDKTATPYLGLAEFINRFLCSETWANRCGALQAAIFRADDEGAGLSDRLYGNGLDNLKLNAGSLDKPDTRWFRHPDNIEVGKDGRVHTALGAPGNLLQSDLLQALGPALATRSDTFTLRCFGEAILPTGESGVAWMEVVVQRTPEFIDRTNPAETGSSAPKPLGFGAPTSADPTTNRNLTLINHLLGRRFKVTSMRWLKTDEI